MSASLPIPDDVLDLIAKRAAEIVLARLAPQQPPDWMSIEDASRYLGCSVERLRSLKKRGRIPCHQEGPRHRVFFRRVELDAWMQQARSASATPAATATGSSGSP